MSIPVFRKWSISALALVAGGLVVFALFPRFLEASLGATSWPMFGQDLRHTGRSVSVGPNTAVQRWTYSTGNIVITAPAVGADGTVYLGAYDGKLLRHQRGRLVQVDEEHHVVDQGHSGDRVRRNDLLR